MTQRPLRIGHTYQSDLSMWTPTEGQGTLLIWHHLIWDTVLFLWRWSRTDLQSHVKVVMHTKAKTDCKTYNMFASVTTKSAILKRQ